MYMFTQNSEHKSQRIRWFPQVNFANTAPIVEDLREAMLATPPCHPPTSRRAGLGVAINHPKLSPTVARKVSFAWPLLQVHDVEVRAHL